MTLTDEQRKLAAKISYYVGRMMGAKDAQGCCETRSYNKGKTVCITTYCDAGVFKTKITTEKE